MILPTHIKALIDQGALVVCNHSGGKDSQAMYLGLAALVPADQLVVVHAELPGVDWPGTIQHIQDTTAHALHITKAGKTFFQMVEGRGMWPSPKYRQCTSDLKRGPIEKVIRRLSRETGRLVIISAQGLRADESPARAKVNTWALNKRNSKAGRAWYDWLPIHALTALDVFDLIAQAGEKPHWAYGEGMSRLSCSFCFMASKCDYETAKRLRPELHQAYANMERKIDQTFFMPTKGKRQFMDER